MNIKVSEEEMTKEQKKERTTAVTFAEFRDNMVGAKPDSKVDLAALTVEAVKELTGQDLSDDSRMVVLYSDYFSRITDLLDRTPDRTILNYLGFRTMLDHAFATTKQLKSIQAVMVEVLTGISVPNPT